MEAPGRRAPRITPHRMMFVEYPDHLARVRNLSLYGAFIEDSRPLPVGQRLHFTLWLDDFSPMETEAVIRRREESQGLGVEFLHMSTDAQARLRQTIESALT